MVFCPSCGAEKKEGSKFCHNCGYEFKAADSGASQSPSPSAQVNQSSSASVQSNQNSHNIAKALGYIFAILIPLIGIVIGIYLWVCKEEEVHKHGMAIVGLSIFVWIISFLLMGSF